MWTRWSCWEGRQGQSHCRGFFIKLRIQVCVCVRVLYVCDVCLHGVVHSLVHKG